MTVHTNISGVVSRTIQQAASSQKPRCRNLSSRILVPQLRDFVIQPAVCWSRVSPALSIGHETDFYCDLLSFFPQQRNQLVKSQSFVAHPVVQTMMPTCKLKVRTFVTQKFELLKTSRTSLIYDIFIISVIHSVRMS